MLLVQLGKYDSSLEDSSADQRTFEKVRNVYSPCCIDHRICRVPMQVRLEPINCSGCLVDQDIRFRQAVLRSTSVQSF